MSLFIDFEDCYEDKFSDDDLDGEDSGQLERINERIR